MVPIILSLSLLMPNSIDDLNMDSMHSMDKCSEFAQVKKDDVTGRQVVISKDRIKLKDARSSNPYTILISRQGFEMLLVLSTESKICMKKATDVRMKLSTGSYLNFDSSNGNNCIGQLNLSFGGIYGNLNQFMEIANSNIEEIVFSDNDDKTVSLILTKSQQSKLKNTIDCIMTASI